MAPELGIGFAQLEHELNLPENQPVQSVIHSISLDQVPHPGLKIQCEIIRVKDNLGNVRKGKEKTSLKNIVLVLVNRIELTMIHNIFSIFFTENQKRLLNVEWILIGLIKNAYLRPTIKSILFVCQR